MSPDEAEIMAEVLAQLQRRFRALEMLLRMCGCNHCAPLLDVLQDRASR